MGEDWYVRRYLPQDLQRLRTFDCSTPGAKWTKVPRKMIRDAPDLLEDPESDVTILVAAQTSYDWLRRRPRETRVVLGVCVYAVEDGVFISHALGVVRNRRREGIGWALKQVAMANAVADGAEREVVSQVHRRNIEMNALNRKLQAATSKDPEDGELLLTMVLAQAKPPDPFWHRPADVVARFARTVLPGPWRTPHRPFSSLSTRLVVRHNLGQVVARGRWGRCRSWRPGSPIWS